MHVAMRKAMYHKYGGRCAYCGCSISFEKFTVDHIHPKCDGGPATLENFNPACRPCNHYKDSLTVDEFREEIAMFTARFVKYLPLFRMALKYNLVTITDSEVKFYFELN